MKNIIFVESDSMDGRAMGCMGHSALQGLTPNIDDLAEHGTLFEHTYCTNPICICSRASMWSGQFTHHCHAWNNYTGLTQQAPTGFSELEMAGYQTGIYGKVDIASGQHSTRAKVTAWTRSANIHRPSYNMPAPTIEESDQRMVHQVDWENLQKSKEFLQAHTQSDTPFFLYLGLNVPHPEFETSRYYYDKVNLAEIEIPPKDTEMHPVMQYQLANKAWAYGTDDAMKRKVRAVYYAMIMETDEIIGELMQTTKDLGLWEDTYFVYISDHGEMNMEHDQYYKMNLYEPSVRVPFVIAGADVVQNKRVPQLTSLIDIVPTLFDLADVPSDLKMDGKSLAATILNVNDLPEEKTVFSEYHDSTLNTGAAMLVTPDYKYIYYAGYPAQLFDRHTDPWEINNLVSTHPEQCEAMHAQLNALVDFDAVDAAVKEQDKRCFRVWQQEQKENGTYDQNMALIYSGFDYLTAQQTTPWTAQDEEKIVAWLETPSYQTKG